MNNSHRLLRRLTVASITAILLSSFGAVSTRAWTNNSQTLTIVTGPSAASSWPAAVAIDSNDNVYQTINARGSITIGNVTATPPNPTDERLAVAKLDSSGDAVWIQLLGDGFIEPGGIAADSSGNVYLSGHFSGTRTIGSTTITASGTDGFVAKLNSSGAVQWAVNIGGTGFDWAPGVGVDGSGNVYVSGGMRGSVSFGAAGSLTSAGSNDIYLAKLNSSGVFQWATKVGGTGDDNPGWIQSLVVDSAGNSYVSGQIAGNVTVAGTTLTSRGAIDVFVAKANSAGVWQWATSGGSTVSDNAYGIDIDASGNVYVGGIISGASVFGSINISHVGLEDAYVAKLDASGNWMWVKTIASSAGDFLYGVNSDSVGNVTVTGSGYGSVTLGGTTLTNSGDADLFAAQWDTSGTFKWLQGTSNSAYDGGYGVVNDSHQNVYISAEIHGPSNVAFGSGASFAILSGCSGNCMTSALWGLGLNGSPITTTTSTSSSTTVAPATTTTVVGSTSTTVAAVTATTIASSSKTSSGTPNTTKSNTTTNQKPSTETSTSIAEAVEPEQPLTNSDAPKAPPAVEVEAGVFAATVNGKPASTQVRQENKQAILSVQGIVVTVSCVNAEGNSISPTADGKFSLSTGDKINIAVQGAQANTDFNSWIFSDPLLLGHTTTDSTGIAETTYELPASLKDGNHTLAFETSTNSGDSADLRYGIIVENASGGSSTLSTILLVVLALAALTAIFIPAAVKRRNKNA